jgi:LytS/YehU family sensor histidine kinase
LQTITVYTENFNRKVEMDYEIEKIRGVYLDIGKGPDHFMVQTNMNEYTYRFQKNWLYYLKFPAYLIIYFFSVLFIWLIQNIREKQLHEKFELKNQLKEMEIKYLRMQMDPHFMFNAFTTMALMIKNGDRTEAFDSFMKFTRMLRSNFDFSNHLTRPLSEELQTVKDYLEINKLRFKERLNYEVSVTDDVPVNALIPKMIIQIHVENSLKHGLSQQEKPGVIRIDVVKDGDYLGLSVQDNGIGRKKAATLDRPSTKQGIKMLQALIDRLNAQNKLNITQGYTDLQDDSGNPAGTRVDIKVPLSLKEMVES